MAVYRVWEGNPPSRVDKIPQEVVKFVDGQGRYEEKLTKKSGFIAVFGANATHLTGCAGGIHSGGGQAKGVINCKNVMPLDTMYFASSESLKRDALLGTIRYQFAEMAKRPNTPFIIPYKVLDEKDLSILKSTKANPYQPNANETYTAIISEECSNQGAVKQWLNGLKVGDQLVNVGFGICTAPDIEALYVINTLAEKVFANQGKNKAQGSSNVAEEITSWASVVLQNVSEISKGSKLDLVKKAEEELKKQTANSHTKKLQDTQKLQNVLSALRTRNAFKTLGSKQILNIFSDAVKHRCYSRRPRLRMRVDVKEAKLMRKFSVEFQKECQKQSLIFSNTHSTGNNTNGMRTKSVVDFLNQNNNGDIAKLVKGAGWR